ncbi:Gfo/Idh/MocA family oxidoreductase [Dehalococcoidia bacterium]|nr:Gfo/Idh/MocA family oxidoreductase [Dehalococcoidia bacterium]
MSTETLKVGVVGCGLIAQDAHIPSLRKCKNARLVAVCDRNGELAESVARKFRIGRHYVDFAEMLSKERLDVVDICTSINTHASLSIQAMEAGCHVLVEKPMALTTGETDEMISASERNRVKLGVVHDMLFGLAMMRIKSMVKAGAIGQVLGVCIKHSFPRQYFPIIQDRSHWWHQLPGGVFGDTLPHPIYLAREFLGDLEPAVVHTNKIGHLEHLPFDEVQIVLEGKNGVGTIISSANWPSLLTIDVFGTRMNLRGDLYNAIVLQLKEKGSPVSHALENLNQSFQIVAGLASNGIKAMLGKYGGHRLLINEFMQSIQNGAEPPVTAQDGREVVRVMEKITDGIM